MKYITGAKLLERGIILDYILKAGAPVAMPEIFLLRGIPVGKKKELCQEDQKRYTSRATSTRHLMLRLCTEGSLSEDKEQLSFWSLHFRLTPKGRKEAEECEEFLSYIDDLRRQVARTLKGRSQCIRDTLKNRSRGTRRRPIFPEEKVLGQDAGVTRDQSSPVIEPGPRPPTLASKEVRPAPKTVPKTPASVPRRPSPKPIAPVPVPPEATSRLAVILAPKARPHQLRCPACPNVFPLASVKREMDSRGRFECDCGADLTGKATELLDGIAAGA